ncbi:hypothetical protein [Aequorivita sp. CIP111184]|uniref:hypothetical protein n=1 Tax=Aequorivita sp. CIP111184 TaxID=2211356 RepID=UPI0015ECB06D|nr:hypothetical protein [Aequorivita sp. CIP111184]
MKTSLSLLTLLIGFTGFSQNVPVKNTTVIDSILRVTEKISSADKKVIVLS